MHFGLNVGCTPLASNYAVLLRHLSATLLTRGHFQDAMFTNAALKCSFRHADAISPSALAAGSREERPHLATAERQAQYETAARPRQTMGMKVMKEMKELHLVRGSLATTERLL